MQTNTDPNPETPITRAQFTELQSAFTEMRGGWSRIKDLPDTVRALQDRTTGIADQITRLRQNNPPGGTPASQRRPGLASDDCARLFMAQFVAQCEKNGRLDALCSVTNQRQALLTFAHNTLDVQTRIAMGTGDVQLPTQFSGEFRELISDFGVARRQMSPYPITMGICRPPRMGTRPAFASIAMSAAFPEKVPQLTFASLESHKVGGLVRLPREIDEQSIVPMGQFLARYAAIEFARLEDNWAFLADGAAGVEQVKGIVQVARDNNKVTTLAAGKTKPSDATLDDFRAMRRLVNKAALNGRTSAYYLDTTWETRLSAFKTQAEPNVYQRLPDGSAILDGYPIIWTDVLQPYDTLAAPGLAIAVFGALSFWWFGEHGHPRVDTSDQVYFANDQLAVRCIEEIDFDYMATDATSALITATS